ncbi:hypothetical protein [Singulisphaera sp. PoT]|uniref:hypothetical protein n=1 Tax=Singulisphaera sp. PoT TaxID=3411797 RepID=UPI003BF60D0C
MSDSEIGSVEVAFGDEKAKATLHVGGEWTFEGNEYIAQNLRGRADLIDMRNYSPSQGPFGVSYLNQLAEHFGVQPTFVPKLGQPPGTVY